MDENRLSNTPIGPYSYLKWLACNSGQTLKETLEYPLYSDAHVVGEKSPKYGPYQVFNTISNPYLGRKSRPSLILRHDVYLEFDGVIKFDETDEERYHGGYLEDEIATLLSLCLGIRLKAGGATREFMVGGDPQGRPIAWDPKDDPILPDSGHYGVLPSVHRSPSVENLTILGTFSQLEESEAIALIRAARLYQDAIWISESTPELSWIMLTSAVETAADKWRESEETPLERLKSSRPDLEMLLKEYGGDELLHKVAEEIAPYMGSTNKFIKFVDRFLPDPPQLRPAEAHRHPWTRKSMKNTMQKIYQYRSRALHGGRPFPKPMCEPPFVFENNIPVEIAFARRSMGSTWAAEDVPLALKTFEYIVRNSVLKWWKSIISR